MRESDHRFKYNTRATFAYFKTFRRQILVLEKFLCAEKVDKNVIISSAALQKMT
jgi:hypothetical protein